MSDTRWAVWQRRGLVLACVAIPALAQAQSSTLSALAESLGPRPVFSKTDPDRVALGRLLFFDPVISGNRNISCATCHHPKFDTGDGVSLSLGEGGLGLGPDRHIDVENPPEQRIPRNAQSLFNLGANTVDTFFHDGRLEADANRPHGIRTPLGGDMLQGFDSALSAQAMFPVLSPDEMAGHYAENPIAQAVRQGRLTGDGGAWSLVTERVTEIPAYREKLDQIYGAEREIQFTDIANLLADFIAEEWRADDSPFDRALRDEVELQASELRGLNAFYGKANCASCHSGWLHTDQQFHAIGMPQLGPGKAARFESHARDDGRLRVTGDDADRYRFRTPSLRNVALTAPYGHTGAYATLEAVVRHHLDPVTALTQYNRDQAILPTLAAADDWAVLDNPDTHRALANQLDITPVALSDSDVADLVSFLHTLTDSSWRVRSEGVPVAVPSGLPVDQ